MSKRKPKGGKPDGMSHRRHRKFGGKAGESPKLRLQKKMEVERNEVKVKENPTMTESVKKLFEE